jgi:formylglycine-generating enzyme required for sulfatase activity
LILSGHAAGTGGWPCLACRVKRRLRRTLTIYPRVSKLDLEPNFLGALAVSRIFLSHSSANDVEAVAIRDWLSREGWQDVFLDIDPDRGIAAGERWERALNVATSRCEAVLFLVSRQWLDSGWCLKEFNLAYKLNKRLFGLLVEDLPVADLPFNLTSTWQLVRLCSGTDHVMLRVTMPFTGDEAHVTFSAEGLGRLKTGLQRAGLDPRFFDWPPAGDPDRAPYRGLRPLEADDAGIFFGRDAAIVDTLDSMRGLRDGGPPRLLVILGASGAGKSSFLRAGLFPRLARDDESFLPLPIIRPERIVITGDSGLLRALEGAFGAARIAMPRADLRAAIQGGAATLKPLLQALAEKATPRASDAGARPKPPALVLSIDQGEELFLAEAQEEAQPFLVLLRDLLIDDVPAVIIAFTIRSDNYERLQLARELDGVRQEAVSLSAMPRGSYSEVIKGPAQRLEGTGRALKIEDGLVDALLADVEAGGDAKDALPLLAFTLERLYDEYHAGGSLKLSHYNDLGRVKGSIETAVDQAFKAADSDPAIPKDRIDRLALLRRALIPWLAGIDPDNGAPRRRVARLSEIPAEARPLIQLFVEQRLLTTDLAKDTGEQTIEPAHEALLRQWSLLQGWLAEDAGLLSVLDGVKRAARDWAAIGKNSAWLVHVTGRLEAAERLSARPDLAAHLGATDRDYLAACRRAESSARGRRRLVQAVIYLLLVGIITGLMGWINQDYIKEQANWYVTMKPHMISQVRPYVLATEAEKALKPLSAFRECAKNCPEMIVIPAGTFMMGSPAEEKGRTPDEGPLRPVTIAKPFAVSKHLVTFDDWDACVSVGGCPPVSASGFGRGALPVINVSWKEAGLYAAWLSRMTNRRYRLLTEAEWEYAARAGTTTRYSFGDDESKLEDYAWYNGNSLSRTHAVGSKKPNAFGLYDVHGNVWQWVADCYAENYSGAPSDGSARGKSCAHDRRVARGGSWETHPGNLRSARRGWYAADRRAQVLGFRLARSLGQ